MFKSIYKFLTNLILKLGNRDVEQSDTILYKNIMRNSDAKVFQIISWKISSSNRVIVLRGKNKNNKDYHFEIDNDRLYNDFTFID